VRVVDGDLDGGTNGEDGGQIDLADISGAVDDREAGDSGGDRHFEGLLNERTNE